MVSFTMCNKQSLLGTTNDYCHRVLSIIDLVFYILACVREGSAAPKLSQAELGQMQQPAPSDAPAITSELPQQQQPVYSQQPYASQ